MNSSLETTPNSTATIEFFGRRLDISRLFAGTLLASPLRRRFTSNVAFIVAGNGASQAASLLAYFAVARVLGKDAFGRFSLVQNTAVVLAGLTGCLGLTATKHLAAFRASDSRRAGAALGLLDTAAFAAALTMAVVLFFGATPVSAVAFHAASLAPLLRIAALLLFFTAITNSQSGALAGFEAYKRMTGPLFFRAAMILPVFVAGAALAGITGALWALTAIAAMVCIWNRRILQQCCRAHAIRPDVRAGLKEWGLLGRFSAPAFLIGIIPAPCLWLGQAMLAHQPHGFAECGAFAAAFQYRMAITALPGLLAAPLVPMISNIDLPDAQRRNRMIGAVCLAALIVSGVPALIMGLFSPWFMRAYGSRFVVNSAVLAVLASSAVVSAVGNPIVAALTSMGRMWHVFAANVLWAAVFLISAAGLVPLHKASGLASAQILADLCLLVCVLAAYAILQRTACNKLLRPEQACGLEPASSFILR
ncbi:MAG: oligosaccharide flippase family protein [Terracidiphilus sp.]|jgi:O-antigen/teichoic acid export membrane protein